MRTIKILFIVGLVLIIGGCKTEVKRLEPIKEDTEEIGNRSETNPAESTSETERKLSESNDKIRSIWRLESDDKKKLVVELEEGFYQPIISPDNNKIALMKVTEAIGDDEYGFPAVYDLQTKTMKELPPQSRFNMWNAVWFEDSKKLLIDGKTILELETWSTINLKGTENNLGGKPSPDGSKIAVFKSEDRTGVPLELLLYNQQGELIKQFDTQLEAEFLNNSQSAGKVHFDWLNDNETIILEGWNQKENTADIYLLHTITGELKKIMEKAYRPVLSPNYDRIAVLEMEGESPRPNHNRIGIYDISGLLLTETSFDDPGLFLWEMEWSSDGSSLYIETTFLVENVVDKNGVIVWKVEEDKAVDTIFIPNDTYLLDINNNSFLIMDRQ